MAHCQMDASNDYDQGEFETFIGYVAKSTGPGQVYFEVVKTIGDNDGAERYIAAPQVKQICPV